MKASPNQAQNSGYSFAGSIQSATNKKAHIPENNKKAAFRSAIKAFFGFLIVIAAVIFVPIFFVGGDTPNYYFGILFVAPIFAGLITFFGRIYPNMIQLGRANNSDTDLFCYEDNAAEPSKCLTDPSNINGDAMLVKESLGLI